MGVNQVEYLMTVMMGELGVGVKGLVLNVDGGGSEVHPRMGRPW